MRIALVASPVSPLRHAQANGPQSVIVDLARGLSARGHAVKVYAAARSTATSATSIPTRTDPAAGAAVRVGEAAPADATAALNRSFETLFAQVRHDGPDAISQHAFDAIAFELADGLPVLHTLHLPPLSASIVASVRRTRDRLATVSLAAQQQWQGATGRDISVLPNGVPDLERAPGAVMPIALIAGRISPEKGTDTAIRVARRAGLAVMVAGDVYDSDYYVDSVEPLLRPREWIGPVSRAELFQLMARCAVLLMPVRWDEAFGLVAAEAQMAGCPVVAYRRGALAEVVRHGSGGWLVDPGDEEALVSAVYRARTLDRDSIRRRARAELGVDRMVDAYERALRSVASGAPVEMAS